MSVTQRGICFAMCFALLNGCASQDESEQTSTADGALEQIAPTLLESESKKSCTPGDDLANAPPTADVDGLHAVPIDIQHLDAKVVLDAASRTASVDITLKFRMGPSAS